MEVVKHRPPDSNGGRHFSNAFRFCLKVTRHQELRDFLEERGMKIFRDYRLSYKWPHKEGVKNDYYRDFQSHPLPFFFQNQFNRDESQVLISFRDRKKAVWFKLVWEECEVKLPPDSPQVILPFIRRVMPTMIANSIVGCSPMTGPVSQIYTMKARYQGAASTSTQISKTTNPEE